MILKLLFIFYFSLAFSSYSFADKSIFDVPKSQSKISVGKSQDAKGQIQFDCWNYTQFALVQISDPALIGAKEVILRYKTRKADLCAKEFIGKSLKLNLDGTYYFKGVVGNYLFFDGADSFGGQLSFIVTSAKDGKTVLSSRRDDNKSMEVMMVKNGTPALRYYKTLKITCPLAKDGQNCWQKILKENEIPASAKLSEPECKSSFLKEKSSLDNPALVSVPVVIRNLSKPKIVFTAGNPSCEPAP